MKIRFLILFVLCSTLILSACFRDVKFDTPKIPEDQMVLILTDIHLAEGMISDFLEQGQTARDSIANLYYHEIFRIHKVNAADFEQSMNAYVGNPVEMSKLYEKVLEKLQRDESANTQH